LGYGLGSTEIIKRMWERKLPWSVNTFACSMEMFWQTGGNILPEHLMAYCRKETFF
jgi:hypothetical protein